jgi:LAS superfamily LD-carboxypeptidase LdcB
MSLIDQFSKVTKFIILYGRIFTLIILIVATCTTCYIILNTKNNNYIQLYDVCRKVQAENKLTQVLSNQVVNNIQSDDYCGRKFDSFNLFQANNIQQIPQYLKNWWYYFSNEDKILQTITLYSKESQKLLDQIYNIDNEVNNKIKIYNNLKITVEKNKPNIYNESSYTKRLGSLKEYSQYLDNYKDKTLIAFNNINQNNQLIRNFTVTKNSTSSQPAQTIEKPPVTITLESTDKLIETSRQLEKQFIDSNSAAALETFNKKDANEINSQLKIFTALEFNQLYESIIYPFTQELNLKEISIFGNEKTDNIILQKAKDRGYKVRRQAEINRLQAIDNGVNKLQPETKIAWEALKSAALKQDIKLIVNSAYRSNSDQQKLFLSRWDQTITPEVINNNQADNAINNILSVTAPPSTSRHLTGNTIDFGCENEMDRSFDKTSCFKWLSENNYFNIKRFGFIPSYPEGIDKQGPEPESWEYTWVGLNNLKKI